MKNKISQILLINYIDGQEDNLLDILSSHAYETTIIHNREQGFTHLIENPKKYSVVIINSNTDDTDNTIHLLYKINSCSNLKILPLIVASAKYNAQEVKKYIHAGAQYYMENTLQPDTILTIVRTAIQNYVRYLEISQAITTPEKQDEHCIKTLTSATFQVQRLEEAQKIANFIAKYCPNPQLFIIGISEILINAIEHGNLNISYEEKTILQKNNKWIAEIDHRLTLPENCNKYVTVTLKQHHNQLNILVTDCGNGFNWKKYQNLDPKRIYHNHGRGILMARTIAFEKLTFHGNGNKVECLTPKFIKDSESSNTPNTTPNTTPDTTPN